VSPFSRARQATLTALAPSMSTSRRTTSSEAATVKLGSSRVGPLELWTFRRTKSCPGCSRRKPNRCFRRSRSTSSLSVSDRVTHRVFGGPAEPPGILPPFDDDLPLFGGRLQKLHARPILAPAEDFHAKPEKLIAHPLFKTFRAREMDVDFCLHHVAQNFLGILLCLMGSAAHDSREESDHQQDRRGNAAAWSTSGKKTAHRLSPEVLKASTIVASVMG